jgi:hypothetical protein
LGRSIGLSTAVSVEDEELSRVCEGILEGGREMGWKLPRRNGSFYRQTWIGDINNAMSGTVRQDSKKNE